VEAAIAIPRPTERREAAVVAEAILVGVAGEAEVEVVEVEVAVAIAPAMAAAVPPEVVRRVNTRSQFRSAD